MNTEILSLVALVIALTSTIINYLVLRLRQSPDVVVYALPDSRRPSIINLIIENTGRSRARNVIFQANRPIPTRAFGFNNAPEPDTMKDGPLVNGISSFAAGEKRVITWGQFHGLKRGLGDDVLEITATYKSYPALRITPRKHNTTSYIDIKSFKGIDASDNNWDKKSADQLERIAKTLININDALESFKQRDGERETEVQEMEALISMQNSIEDEKAEPANKPDRK